MQVAVQRKPAARGLWKKVQQLPDGVGGLIANANPLREKSDERGCIGVLRVDRSQQCTMLFKPLQSFFHMAFHDVPAKLGKNGIGNLKVLWSRSSFLAGSAWGGPAG